MGSANERSGQFRKTEDYARYRAQSRSASIRRVIKHAGFDTLPKLLDLSEKDIDALFEWRDADVIIELRERYRANPEDFASSVLQKREIDAEAVDETLSKAKASYVAPRKFSASNAGSLLFAHDGPTSLPSMPFSDALRGFEKRAREAFDDLDDRFDDVMVYQTFEEFPTDLDELSDASCNSSTTTQVSLAQPLP